MERNAFLQLKTWKNQKTLAPYRSSSVREDLLGEGICQEGVYRFCLF